MLKMLLGLTFYELASYIRALNPGRDGSQNIHDERPQASKRYESPLDAPRVKGVSVHTSGKPFPRMKGFDWLCIDSSIG